MIDSMGEAQAQVNLAEIPLSPKKVDVLKRAGEGYRGAVQFLLEPKSNTPRTQIPQEKVSDAVAEEVAPLENQLREAGTAPRATMRRVERFKKALIENASVLNEHRGEESEFLLQKWVELKRERGNAISANNGSDALLPAGEGGLLPQNHTMDFLRQAIQEGKVTYREPTLGFPIVSCSPDVWVQLRKANYVGFATEGLAMSVALDDSSRIRFLLVASTISNELLLHEGQHFVSWPSREDRMRMRKESRYFNLFREEMQSRLLAHQGVLDTSAPSVAASPELNKGRMVNTLPDELYPVVQRAAGVLEVCSQLAKIQGIPVETFVPLVFGARETDTQTGFDIVEERAKRIVPQRISLTSDTLNTLRPLFTRYSLNGVSLKVLVEVVQDLQRIGKEFQSSPEQLQIFTTGYLDNANPRYVNDLQLRIKEANDFLGIFGFTQDISPIIAAYFQTHSNWRDLGLSEATIQQLAMGPGEAVSTLALHGDSVAAIADSLINMFHLDKLGDYYVQVLKGSPVLLESLQTNQDAIKARWREVFEQSRPPEIRTTDELHTYIEQKMLQFDQLLTKSLEK